MADNEHEDEKWYYTVSAVYNGGPDTDFDDKLTKLAGQHHGSMVGAGTTLIDPIQRDIEFMFDNETDAQAFEGVLKAERRVRDIAVRRFVDED